MNEETRLILTQLAASLNTTAEFLWATLYKQAVTQSVVWVTISGALLVVVTLLSRALHQWVLRGREKNKDFFFYNEEKIVIAVLLLIIAGGVAGVAFACNLITLLNPDYWALNELLSTIGSR